MNLRFCAVLCMLMVLNGEELRAETKVFWVANGPMASDFDGDGEVTFTDFLHLVNNFNADPEDESYDPRTDLDEDGVTNFNDFLAFSSSYGQAQTSDEPSGDRYIIYVADVDDSSVIALDSDSHLILDYLPYRGPGGVIVSADQQSIYVAEVFGFYKMDTRHQVEFSVPVESRGKAVLSPDQTRAYVADQIQDLVRVVDVVNGVTIDSVLVGDRPIDVALSPDGTKLYVANQTDRNVVVVDLATMTVTARIAIGDIPLEISITQDGTRAYVTNWSRGVISVLDLNTNQVVGALQIDQGGAFGAEFSPDKKLLYVSAVGVLLEIDVERNLIVRTLRLGNDSTILGVSPDGSRAYVATLVRQAGGPGLTVVDLNEWRILGRIRGFFFPREIAFRVVPRITESQ
ncbi:MAG: dockerin type I domain-containing protein [Gemmatimonadetes bacterium]|nr:dockerin type I domain-containing protein [Gemmatimonadota bacterium]